MVASPALAYSITSLKLEQLQVYNVRVGQLIPNYLINGWQSLQNFRYEYAVAANAIIVHDYCAANNY